MTFEDLLKALYLTVGVTLIIPYLIQARVAWKSKHRAQDVSLATWFFWVGTSTVSLLYAAIITKDTGFILVSIGNLSGCLLVALIASWRRFGPAPSNSI